MKDTVELLAGFLKIASGNSCFRQSHISLYSAILMYHDKALRQNPFRISRRELMKYSAIRSFATYHRCIIDLISNRLIEYEPSYHPSLASRITLLDTCSGP